MTAGQAMAAAVYDLNALLTSAWWAEEAPVHPDEWRGRLAVFYVRCMVWLMRRLPSRDMRSPDYDWEGTRRRFARFEGVAAKFPRDVARADADDIPVPSEWFGDTARRIGNSAARTVLYVHGGSYVLERNALHDVLAAHIARESDARVLSVDYRLAPEHPFPSGVEDIVAAYRHLLATGTPAGRIAVVGDSAGGGLALAALVAMRDRGIPMPAAFSALSPWADLTFSGGSVIYNANSDPFMSDVEFVSVCAELYLQGHSPLVPLASPALADLHGMPPTLVHVGSTDLLLDDSRRIVDGIRAAGGRARLDIWRNMPHVWQRLAAYIPEASDSLASIGQFLKAAIPDPHFGDMAA
ncbi:alpha/beta hydrolase [Qipengyuania sp. ASV99]|uniref:alpha/beta hydrolase n=1 Tax=Qipengyuania sp. ASV99 TaxID=3399681 RepID=UPI003A4C5DEA